MGARAHRQHSLVVGVAVVVAAIVVAFVVLVVVVIVVVVVVVVYDGAAATLQLIQSLRCPRQPRGPVLAAGGFPAALAAAGVRGRCVMGRWANGQRRFLIEIETDRSNRQTDGQTHR